MLGDTFLRNAYVVYDLQNNQISLAQTNFNATDSNVREIVSGANGVPGASSAPSPVSSLAVTAGGARGPSVTGIPNAAIQSVKVSDGLWLCSLLTIGATGIAAILL